MLCLLCNYNAATERAHAAVLGNRSRIHIGRSVRSAVYDLRAGVQVLTFARKGNAGKFTSRAFASQQARRLQIGNMGTKGTGYPFNRAALFYLCPLGI